jgi:hypothetical protein
MSGGEKTTQSSKVDVPSNTIVVALPAKTLNIRDLSQLDLDSPGNYQLDQREKMSK